MRPNDVSSIERLLADWADWMHRGGSTTDGYPRKMPGAPDARIHSIEDMEIEVDSRLMRTINAAVDSLDSPHRFCIMRRYGLMAAVWRLANEQDVYESAINMLHSKLKTRIVV